MTEPRTDTHRGAFGDYGGESRGLIERTFRERIVTVGVTLPGAEQETEASLEELGRLVDTAGADVVATVVQNRRSPDPATYIGSGKVEELTELADAVDADTVVFDVDLTPAQQFNLERSLGRTALDRTAVILDIFAQNAHTPEGAAQVELAQLKYRLPRLRGRGHTLSQQAGGIGTRGPGETQLEVDRRRLTRRIHQLEDDLRRISAHRSTQRKARRRAGRPHVAIVGYTNAGKSTLLNHLTESGVLAEDRLFATLDPTTRRLDLPGGEQILLTDTVGFVRRLPHQLVQAFQSTLAVVPEADLLIHVVDASDPDPDGQIRTVNEVLAEIGGGERPQIIALNKVDRLDPGERETVAGGHPGAVLVSAVTGEGIAGLLAVVADRLREGRREREVVVPWTRGQVVPWMHRVGEVVSERAETSGIRVVARLDPQDWGRFDAWELEEAEVAGP